MRNPTDRLRHFVAVVDRCLASPAVVGRTLRSNLTIKYVDGVAAIEADFGDPEHVRSLLIDFRKFALLNDDDAYFPKIHNLLMAKVSDGGVRELAVNNRELWNDALTPSIQLQFGDVVFAGDDALRAWVNGELFHDDVKYQKRLAVVATDEDRALFTFVCHQMIELCLIVARRQRFLIADVLERGLIH